MKMHRQLLWVALICVCVLSSQATTFAQNVTVPREPAPGESDGPRRPSAKEQLIRELIGVMARVICEHSGECPRSADVPREAETRPQSELAPGGTRIERKRTGRSSTPSYDLAPSRNFSFFTPLGWRSYEEQTSVTVAPPNEYLNGNLANGVIFGLADLNGKSFESGTDKYVRELLSANKYLTRVGRPESSVFNTVPCITSRLTGPSPQNGYTENVEIYTCQRNAQHLFYVVNVTSGPDPSRYVEENSRVIRSLSFR
jgi:hypothetical protein